MLDRDFVIPYTGVNGSGIILDFEGVTLTAGANNVKLIQLSDCRTEITGSIKFRAGAFTDCWGIAVVPEVI